MQGRGRRPGRREVGHFWRRRDAHAGRHPVPHLSPAAAPRHCPLPSAPARAPLAHSGRAELGGRLRRGAAWRRGGAAATPTECSATVAALVLTHFAASPVGELVPTSAAGAEQGGGRRGVRAGLRIRGGRGGNERKGRKGRGSAR